MSMNIIFVLLGKVYDRVRQNLKLDLPNSLILKYFDSHKQLQTKARNFSCFGL